MAIATFVSFLCFHLYSVLALLSTPMQIQVWFAFYPLHLQGFSIVFEVLINLWFSQILIQLLRMPNYRTLIKYIKGYEANKRACEEGGINPIHWLLWWPLNFRSDLHVLSASCNTVSGETECLLSLWFHSCLWQDYRMASIFAFSYIYML